MMLALWDNYTCISARNMRNWAQAHERLHFGTRARTCVLAHKRKAYVCMRKHLHELVHARACRNQHTLTYNTKTPLYVTHTEVM